MSASAIVERSGRRSVRTGRSNNWWGLLLVIFAEAMFFASLISAYLFLRFQGVSWLPAGSINMDPWLPGLNTVVLLLSSLAVHQASRAIQTGQIGRFRRWMPVAVALGMVFLVVQAYIFLHLGFTPLDTAFGGMFYALTGFHGLRIVIGIGLMLLAFARSLAGTLTRTSHFAVTAATAYWHFLDVVWIVLFVLLYLL